MKFKNEKDKELFFSLHPLLILIYADLYWYAKDHHKIDLVVTSTISTLKEDVILNRTSSSHRNRIALDIRTKDVDPFIVSDLIQYINSKDEYANYRYLSFSGEKRLAFWHIGSAEHIHLSLHSDFALSSLPEKVAQK